MSKNPSRDPGSVIKEQLRREVNFGCPVRFPNGDGCGCPVLTYHHFDPPWANNFQHNPTGMIALCKTHHDLADGGAWSKEQLRAFKSNPFVNDAVRVQWPYNSESLVIKAGKTLVIGSGSPARLNGSPVLSFYSEPVTELGTRAIVFDAEVRDANRNRWLSIEKNWFDLRLAGTTDVLFPPQAKTLIVRHSDSTYLSLRYRHVPLPGFAEWVKTFNDNAEIQNTISSSLESVGAVDSDGIVPVLEFEGKFRTKDVGIEVTGDSYEFESFIPGLREKYSIPGLVVDATRALVFERSDGRAFFGVG